MHDHLDSYPDTEEDEDDFSSDNENDTVTPLKGARRKLPINSSTKASGSSTPIMSPASGRTFDEQKTTNVNLEHLHDSLRRSLAMGSDISRTPTASSPLGGGDNVDREKMVFFLS